MSRIGRCVGILLLSGCILLVGVGVSRAAAVGDTVYLKFNLKYDSAKDKASCVNYQKFPTMFAAGSKITILEIGSGRKGIEIQAESGRKITIELNPEFCGEPQDWLDNGTSATDPKEEWDKLELTDGEKQGIKQGKALVGMRKEAVLIALGTPPIHMTPPPAMEQDSWRYWDNRFNQFVVEFADGKVVNVQQ